LVHDLLAGVAVVADGGCAQPHPRPGLAASRDLVGQRRRRVDPAVEDHLLALVGPALVADPRAGQMDDDVDAVERGRIDLVPGRIPPVLAGRRGRSAYQYGDGLAVRA